MNRMNRDPNRPISNSTSLTFSPLYRQIKDLLIKSLQAGEWGPGDVIPSEAELAVRFNVSQGTVRKAIDEMAAENMLLRRQGKGTFVASHNDPRSFYRFLRLMPDSGERQHAESEPLSCETLPASGDEAKALGLPEGSPVVRIERLLRFDGAAVVFDEIHLSGELFPGLVLDRLLANDRSLYSFLESGFGVRMIRAEERLRAVSAAAHPASMLGVPEGTPLLLVERVAYTYGNKPVEWRRGFYSTQQHHYLNELG